MSFPETEVITTLVSRVFQIEDVTNLDPLRGIYLRYRGQLLDENPAQAYDQLAESLIPYNAIPLFRIENGGQVIYIAPKQPDPKPDKISTNIILFVLTVFSVMLAGVETPMELCNDLGGYLKYSLSHILTGWPFALSLLGILLAHELGHYFMSRYHKTPATLPYFLPFPLSPLGTLGAAIVMRGIPKNRRILFDIGVAGPIAGLVIAIPILFLGLSLSEVHPIALTQCGISLEGNSILYLFAKYVTFGQLLPAPVESQGILYWLKYFFTGQPIPLGGMDVFIHPIAFAGWAGILVTALNLIPIGTLDGGHIIHSLFGEKAHKAFPYIIGVMVVLGFFWSGWWLWVFLLMWLGRVNAQPLDQITSLDPTRKLIAYTMIVVFLLVFMPVPFATLIP